MTISISVGEALFGIIFILIGLYMINLWRAWRMQRRPHRHHTARLDTTNTDKGSAATSWFQLDQHFEDEESRPTKSY